MKTDIGTVTIAPNPLLSVDQAKNYEDGFKLMVSIVPPKTRAQMIGWNLTVEPPSIKSANLLDITLHDENYLRAIDIIKSLVDHYNKYGNEQKDATVRRSEEFVNSRLEKLDVELGISDADWENYKRNHEILEPEAAATEATQKKNEYEEQIKEIDLDILLHDYQSDFINITAWRQTAAFICKYFAKGDGIVLSGKIQTGSYQTNTGEKRYTTEVIAEHVEFPLGKKSGNGQSNNSSYPEVAAAGLPHYAPAPAQSNVSVPEANEPLPFDDDLPF